MKRLDEEMQLNAFIFRDVEQADPDNWELMQENQENHRESPTSEERKKEYILRRAQIVVYQYGKKQETYRKWIIVACILLLAVGIGIINILINGDQFDIFIFGGVCLAALVLDILIIIVFRNCQVKLQNICQEIYSITVKFQTNVKPYDCDSKQQALEKFVMDLEEYVEKERTKEKVNEPDKKPT